MILCLLQVYNETIRDLLLPGNPLPIREDPGKGVVIPGLSLHKVINFILKPLQT